MSGFMQKIFGTNPEPTPAPTPATAPVAAAPVQPGAIPPNAGTTDPLVPAEPVTTPAEPADNSPLAPFSGLWETKPADPNNPNPAEPVVLKAEDVQKIVAKQDFVGMLSPEDLAAVTSGEEGAQEALSKVLNTVIQNVMVQSTMVNNKLTEQAVAKATAAQAAKLPEMLRQGRAKDHLVTENPLFNNPAVKPVIEATQAQLQRQFPNATDAELTKMTQDYVVAIGESFAPPPTTTTDSSGEVDWSDFENQV